MAQTTATKPLTAAERRRLRRLATADDAHGYAEWLRGASKPATENEALAAAAKTADRTAVGYGSAGEELYGTSLADDGYASYLRLAAKEAREARRREIEKGRADGGAALLRGYADYLKKEKEAAGERLLTTATALSKGKYEKAEAEDLIASSGAEGAAADALRALWHPPAKEPELSPERTIEYIVKNQLPSERALEYCRLIGYDDETARRLIKHAELQRSENTDRLLGMLGH